MEKRIGSVILLVSDRTDIQQVNTIISDHAEMILGRQGIPFRERSAGIISLVVEADTDMIGSLTGKLGRVYGVKVKSVLVN